MTHNRIVFTAHEDIGSSLYGKTKIIEVLKLGIYKLYH